MDRLLRHRHSTRRNRQRQRLIALAAGLTISAVAPAQEADAASRIVLTATRYALLEVDAPAALTVVTRADIEARGAGNVLEALRGETGISLQGRTIAGRRSFGIRGMDNKHTLFLVDGKRVSASDGVIGHSDFQLDWIPVQDIDRIEVVRGPMSVLYGAEALGGVVNIITRRPGSTWGGSYSGQIAFADGERGGHGERAALQASGPLGSDWTLAGGASHRHSAAVMQTADPRITESEGRRSSDLSAGLSWRPAPGHQLQVDARAGDELRDGVSRETRAARRYYDNLTTLTRRHVSLGWNADWTGPARLQTQVRAYGSQLQMRNERSNGVVALLPEKLADRIVEAQASFEPAASHRVVTGAEHRSETLRIVGLPGGRSTVNHDALYAQDEFRLAPTLSLTAGLRLDRHGLFGREWSPRAYAVWHPAPGWTVKGGYAHGFKAPTLKQIAPGAIEDQGPNTFYGNPAVRPETSDTVEIGVGRDSGPLAWQAMVFNNRVRDLIYTRLIGVVAGRSTYIYDNRGRATLRGVELSSRWSPGRGFGVGLNYQYLEAEDGLGQRLEKRPRHSAGLRLDWRGGPWRAGVNIEHHAGQVLATGIVAQPLQAVPSITVTGLWASHELAPGLSMSAGIDNLFDLRLVEKSPLFTYAEPPRTLRVALRGRF